MAAPRAAGPAGVLLMGAARAGEATRPRRDEEQGNTRADGVAVGFPIGTSCVGVFLRIPCGLAHYGWLCFDRTLLLAAPCALVVLVLLWLVPRPLDALVELRGVWASDGS